MNKQKRLAEFIGIIIGDGYFKDRNKHTKKIKRAFRPPLAGEGLSIFRKFRNIFEPPTFTQVL